VPTKLMGFPPAASPNQAEAAHQKYRRNISKYFLEVLEPFHFALF
jgi:hypothetical protein